MNKTWDVVVIGGGPAGMMAAGRAAELGRSVLLLEKNQTLGKKLLITGGTRCNLTNNKPEIRTMLKKYKGSDQFLFSAFSQFSVKDTLDFFRYHGMATKEEAEGRIFPASNKAQSVWDVLVRYMKKYGVRIQTNATVSDLKTDTKTNHINIRLKDQTELSAKSCILATGGTSRPETGSTGDGFVWLKKFGHTIIKNNFALVPIALKDEWVKRLSGVTLEDTKITTLLDGKKQDSQKGKLLFTHFGISGPTILNISKEIGELLQYGEVTLSLDLFPKQNHNELKQALQKLLITESNKKIKNTLNKMIPRALADVLLETSSINSDTANHSVRSEDRKKLIALMKAVPLHVKGLTGAEKAVISSGGVALKEVDFKTMQSRLVPNLYAVGDTLNIDRPSGGYSLQLCWTTGFVAGTNASA